MLLLMWLLAAASLHWLKRTPKTCSKPALGNSTSISAENLIFILNSSASVTECDSPPGPDTHVEYIDLCDYIFQITACFPAFLVYCHFCCMTAQVQERGSLTTLTQCTCQTSASDPLFFSVALYSPLTR